VNSAFGGWETWRWDESLFAGAAAYYQQGRLPYAPGLAGALARSLALDGSGRLLDVGCGPGTVTLRLAPLFEAAVGLDPDPGMLACAAQAAASAGVGNVSWVRQRAEALPASLGSFRVVTFAASFHWMDRPRVASAVATMLATGGAVVQVDAPGYRADDLAAEASRGTLPFPPPPDKALDQLRRQYLGGDRRAGQGIRNTSPSGEDQVFQEAGFRPAQTVTVPDQRAITRTIDDVVARIFSNSSTAPHLLGDRLQDFAEDIREILAKASPAGRFSVRLPDNVLRIWRLPGLFASPAGLSHGDADRRSRGPQRGALRLILLERRALVAGSWGSIGVDHPPPGHAAAVGRHDPPHLPRASLAEELSDIAVGHDLPGRNSLDDVKDSVGVLTDDPVRSR
jgi:ubiquinone/menaquinone biosynthesis C-methylase UbiE